MTLVGYSVLVALPAINGAWVDQLGFSEVEVNRVASADLLGLFIGAVLTSALIKRWNRQRLTYLGIALAIIANALCTQYVDYETTLALRFVAGLGSGFYTAVAVAGLGAHSKPREAFNWMLLAFAVSQFLELQLIPRFYSFYFSRYFHTRLARLLWFTRGAVIFCGCLLVHLSGRLLPRGFVSSCATHG